MFCIDNALKRLNRTMALDEEENEASFERISSELDAYDRKRIVEYRLLRTYFERVRVEAAEKRLDITRTTKTMARNDSAPYDQNVERLERKMAKRKRGFDYAVCQSPDPFDLATNNGEEENEEDIDAATEKLPRHHRLPAPHFDKARSENAMKRARDAVFLRSPWLRSCPPHCESSQSERMDNWRRNFMCQQGGSNMNGHVTDMLEKMAEVYELKGGEDQHRSSAYMRAAATIKSIPVRIEHISQFRKLPGIGKNMYDHVEEILNTGRFDKLETAMSNPRTAALFALKKIIWVGSKTAEQLYSKGFRTIDQLRNAVRRRTAASSSILSGPQLIGLRLYEDLLEKIPRPEMEALASVVRGVAEDLLTDVRVDCAGSYRRGKTASGDIDLLLTHPSGDCPILRPLLAKLREMDFLTDDLTLPREAHVVGKSDSYMGICRLLPKHLRGSKAIVGASSLCSGRHRRIDIKSFPNDQRAFALLYFTGSAHFNRSMRLWAKKIGMSLNESELSQVARGERVPCASEIEVFAALGLEYRPPTQRNCFDASDGAAYS
eukprot:g1517.t1